MSTAPEPTIPPDDPRLLQAVQEYLAELESGHRPSRRDLAARYPDLARALPPYLDALDAVHAASPMLGASGAGRHAAPSPADHLSAAEPLGDFRIVREIGRGGMGVVYEAVQMSLGRRVALKVLPFAAALDSRQRQRFHNEAQAAAQLHHSNIVPVYAVGCERGVHFYAMQLIEGQNLAAVIGDLRGGEATWSPSSHRRLARAAKDAPATPAPASDKPAAPALPPADTPPALAGATLTTQRSRQVPDFFRTVTRLVAQAADALDYAHGMGIVHRDVKPANLLVDARGNVWVTDFGLAQFHTDAGLTQSGDLLGTLRYMSPEQAGGGPRGLIDPRTDVYALGATLYELLTLRPIFDGQDRQTLLHQIANDEPRPPRTLDRTIPAELETIVLKAIGKTPTERYATAADMADDLRRFLKDEPIKARRPTLVQRARKWLRRHPSVPVAAAVLLVLLASGSLVAAALIRAEQGRTRQAYIREGLRATQAEQRLELARRSVDEMIQLTEEELADNPALQNLRRRFLESALVYYQEFIEQRGDDPTAQAELAVTRDRVKRILADLATLQGAGQLNLLGEGWVLDDLKASGEQRDQLAGLARRLADQRGEMFRVFRDLTQEQRRERFLELARANETGVAAILDAGQVRRLRQVHLQTMGLTAFRDPEVVAALKLTADQRERLRALEAETFLGRFDRFRGGPPLMGPPPGGPFGGKPDGGPFGGRYEGGRHEGGPRGGPREGGPREGGPREGGPREGGLRGGGPREFGPDKPFDGGPRVFERALEAALEKALAVLTPAQVQRWREMTGEPIKGPRPAFFPGPPPPPRPPDPSAELTDPERTIPTSGPQGTDS